MSFWVGYTGKLPITLQLYKKIYILFYSFKHKNKRNIFFSNSFASCEITWSIIKINVLNIHSKGMHQTLQILIWWIFLDNMEHYIPNILPFISVSYYCHLFRSVQLSNFLFWRSWGCNLVTPNATGRAMELIRCVTLTAGWKKRKQLWNHAVVTLTLTKTPYRRYYVVEKGLCCVVSRCGTHGR